MQKIFFYAGLAISLIVQSISFGNACCGGCYNNYITVVIQGREDLAGLEEEPTIVFTRPIISVATEAVVTLDVQSVTSSDLCIPGVTSDSPNAQKKFVSWGANTVHEYPAAEYEQKELFVEDNSYGADKVVFPNMGKRLWSKNPFCGFKGFFPYSNLQSNDLEDRIFAFANEYKDQGELDFQEIYTQIFTNDVSIHFANVFSKENQDVSLIDHNSKTTAHLLCSAIINYFKGIMDERNFSIEEDIKNIFYIYNPYYRALLAKQSNNNEAELLNAFTWEFKLLISLLNKHCSYRRAVMLRVVYAFVNRDYQRKNKVLLLLNEILKDYKKNNLILKNNQNGRQYSELHVNKYEQQETGLEEYLPHLTLSKRDNDIKINLLFR